MDPQEQKIFDVLRAHEIGMGDLVSSDGVAGIVECDCGWEQVLYQVEGTCSCFDLASNDDLLDCTCGFEDLVAKASSESDGVATEVACAHVAKELTLVLPFQEETLVPALKAHPTEVINESDDSGYLQAVVCGCGFHQTLTRVDGRCSCPDGIQQLDKVRGCDFDRQVLDAQRGGDEQYYAVAIRHQLHDLLALLKA